MKNQDGCSPPCVLQGQRTWKQERIRLHNVDSNLSDSERIQYKIFLSINTLTTSPLPHSEQIKSVFLRSKFLSVFLWQRQVSYTLSLPVRLHYTTSGISNKSSLERVRCVVKAKASRWDELRQKSAILPFPLCSLRQHSAPEKWAVPRKPSADEDKRDRHTWWLTMLRPHFPLEMI